MASRVSANESPGGLGSDHKDQKQDQRKKQAHGKVKVKGEHGDSQ
eukprot:CAMPEP_0203760830 /NCGR_PEP_ID=MMETSP0098-20131031/14038_1 /ASSEMBLY_ACC=CAM_ASM_000208 /TAXON_ID=96639 /ORGANISM=" , Strain NY0313808BC1" /LENGTH=44 /DNA_ID= /DNA_START= /DNA_END= /DNA_ORIENTATION=